LFLVLLFLLEVCKQSHKSHILLLLLLLLLLLHPFNNLSSTTTWVRWHQQGKPFWILLKQEMMGWQWHQLDHMPIICTSLQTDNHASTWLLRCFTGRMPFLPPNQQRLSTEAEGIYTK